MTFNDLAVAFKLTADERAALVWQLAAFRARKTIEALMNVAPQEPMDCSTSVKAPVVAAAVTAEKP